MNPLAGSRRVERDCEFCPNLVGRAEDCGVLVFGGSGCHAGIHLACEVRNDSDYPFDQHELATMVHFMFFHGEDHFEAAFIWRRHSCTHLNALGEKVFG